MYARVETILLGKNVFVDNFSTFGPIIILRESDIFLDKISCSSDANQIIGHCPIECINSFPKIV